MKPLRLIFMGTPEFAVPCFTALLHSGHEMLAAYTAPPRPAGRGQKEKQTPVHRLALAHTIPVFTPHSLKDESAQQAFAALNADAAIVAAYGLLLPRAILEAPHYGCINIHPSLLPRWRGAAPIQRTIMAGDTETGIVIMQMDAGLDTGDMLNVTHEAVPDGTTSGTLHDRLAERSAPLLLKTLAQLADGKAARIKQPEEGVTYANKITKEEAAINWQKPAREIRQHILGLNPAPGATFCYQNERIKILNAAYEDVMSGKTAGTVLDDQMRVQCGNGILVPLTIQRPGKNPMTPQELLRGFLLPPGALLA